MQHDLAIITEDWPNLRSYVRDYMLQKHENGDGPLTVREIARAHGLQADNYAKSRISGVLTTLVAEGFATRSPVGSGTGQPYQYQVRN